MEINLISLIFLLLFVIAMIIVVIQAARNRIMAGEADKLRLSVKETEERYERVGNEYRQAISEQTQRITALTAELASAESRIAVMKEQAIVQKEELAKLQDSFRLEFRNLANEIMDEKSNQFRTLNRESLDALLKPFGRNITDFRERVEKIYSEQNLQSGELKSQLRNLHELNRKITEETINLTNALKGNSKVQGDWGETILQTILENTNLRKDVHYTVQENLKDEQGRNLRPDVIVSLPDKKRIIIDSKVSLTAYVDYAAARDENIAKIKIAEHIASVKRHTEELCSKKYHEYKDNSLDFVVMFIPSEPAFLAALNEDNGLFTEAYRKKVVICGPTNLLMVLRIADDLWRVDNQNRNVMEIARQGGALYDKFVGFIDTFEAVGKSLSASGAAYEKAKNQLRDGNGNLIGRMENLRRLGAKANKVIPSQYLESIEDGHGTQNVSGIADQRDETAVQESES